MTIISFVLFYLDSFNVLCLRLFQLLLINIACKIWYVCVCVCVLNLFLML